MKKYYLLDYVTDSVEDKYAMEVLYNVMKQTVATHHFDLKDVQHFHIDGRFHGEEISISIRTQYKTTMHILALLLSIRVLMINNKCISNCEDDFLVFPPSTRERFEWIGYADIIMSCMDDDEFSMIYEMLESVYFDEELEEEQITKFRDSVAIPEYKNILLFYQNKAARNIGAHINKDVICNNAFVGERIVSYEVPEDIVYVGNTAFSYCNSLKELRFKGKVLFGKFPIVECPQLQHIIVQEQYLDYYKEQLPFYKDIITTEEKMREESEKLKQEKDSNKADIKPKTDDGKRRVDTESLDKVFDKKVTSYKYFWWLSIISLAKERNLMCIPYKDIIVRMASLAWPLVFDEKISFGGRDMMSKYLDEINNVTMLDKTSSIETVEKHLNRYYTTFGVDDILTPLLKNVPFRFLSPWIKFTTNEDVAHKSKSTDYIGPYVINVNNILLNDKWRDYLKDNYLEQCLFSLRSFIDYAALYNNDTKVKSLFKVLWSQMEKYGNGWGKE